MSKYMLWLHACRLIGSVNRQLSRLCSTNEQVAALSGVTPCARCMGLSVHGAETAQPEEGK